MLKHVKTFYELEVEKIGRARDPLRACNMLLHEKEITIISVTLKVQFLVGLGRHRCSLLPSFDSLTLLFEISRKKITNWSLSLTCLWHVFILHHRDKVIWLSVKIQNKHDAWKIMGSNYWPIPPITMGLRFVLGFFSRFFFWDFLPFSGIRWF